MTKHQAPRQFETSLQPTCPVAELALRYGAAEKDWRILSDQPLEDVEDAMNVNEMTLCSIADFAALSQPTSPLGALFQVLIVSQQADSLCKRIEGDARHTASNEVICLESALWGVRRFLETHFGISAADIGGERMMTESASYGAKLRKAVAAASEAPVPQFLQAAE